jgi:hypothetical protein
VVNGIDHRFLDGGKRKVPETLGLGPVGVFDDGLFEIICLDVVQRITCDTGKGAFENFLIKAISSRAFRKPNYIDLLICCNSLRPAETTIVQAFTNDGCKLLFRFKHGFDFFKGLAQFFLAGCIRFIRL